MDQSFDRTRHARGEKPEAAETRNHIPFGILIHVGGRLAGRLLAEVEEVRFAILKANEHEAAAADVASRGMHDGERKPSRHSRIDRIPARFHHFHARFRRERVHADDHAMLGTLGPHTRGMAQGRGRE